MARYFFFAICTVVLLNHGYASSSGNLNVSIGSEDNVTPVPAYSPASFTIVAGTRGGGDIVPSGEVAVNLGEDIQFQFNPDQAFRVDSVFVDGYFVGKGIRNYWFYDVSSSHTINVKFRSSAIFR